LLDSTLFSFLGMADRDPTVSDPSLAHMATITDRTAADFIVTVPEMAESISEGTLKQFTKRMLLMK
jgi:hypothetical protein